MAIPKGRSQHKLGDWQCEVVKHGDDVKHCVVVMHGFGATNGDFLPFADQMKAALGGGVMWVFPQANRDEALDAAAWWRINVMEWVMAAMTQNQQALAQIIRKEPEGLGACRDSGKRMIESLLASHPGLTHNSIHLAGFSQGAMTAMDLALTLPSPVGSICMFSGSPIVVDQWAARFEELHAGKHNVFISHGRADQVLPFAASGWVRDLVEQKGRAKVTYVAHNGGHDLGGEEVMSKLVGFWKTHCGN